MTLTALPPVPNDPYMSREQSMTVRITLRRHGLYLIWEMYEEPLGGRPYLVASGAEKSRKKALDAADMWRRVYVRNRLMRS